MYLDTSIIVKLLVDEPDTEFFQRALQGKFLSSSELAVTEIWSGLKFVIPLKNRPKGETLAT